MDPLVVHKVGDKTSRERRVLDLIEMVGLPNSVLDALPGQLSGGWRQRVFGIPVRAICRLSPTPSSPTSPPAPSTCRCARRF